MSRKSIGIDLDTTLNNLEEAWLNLYNLDYNDNLTTDKITAWEIHKFTKPECQEKFYDYLFTPGLFRNLGIKPHAQEVVEFLSKHYDLYIVTAYHWKTAADKAEWVIEKLPWIDSKNIIFCNNKSLIDLDYLVDDGVHNLKGFKGKGLVFDAWHNKNCDDFPRLHGWLEVKEYFEKELVL